MKKKTGIAIAVTVIAAVVLLFPVRLEYKDGGSVEYRSLAYSITRYHRLSLDDTQGFQTGWRIKLFGITLRDDLR